MTRRIRNLDTLRFTGFESWVNTNPNLDSQELGLSVLDIDKIYYHLEKWVCYVLVLELKSFGRYACSEAQREGYRLIDQLFRERHGGKVTVYGSDYTLQYNGCYVVSFSRDGPEDSDQIKIKHLVGPRVSIDVQTLEDIIAFRINPNDFVPDPENE
jgi:hypothetical protein